MINKLHPDKHGMQAFLSSKQPAMLQFHVKVGLNFFCIGEIGERVRKNGIICRVDG